ncbi:C25 family cysteine peptidase [Lentimicrobium sp.]|uniref:C25 family cysteine peptidase n=1 Tax=Lentimicrobium sp. TaxID=2034841 RepID=UPI002C7B0E5D|nr:C25 family cysteine peptidase [Lentimicrobium sp.]HPR24737.1 C25 family cysteine peptidase [Lentimicrobium sp.]
MKKSLTLLLSMLLLSFHALSQEWISVNSGKPESSLFGVNSATSGGSRIQVSLPGFYRTGECTPEQFSGKLMLPDGVIETEAGKPDLQHLTISLQLPDRGNPVLHIVRSEFTEYKDYNIHPVKGDPGIAKKENRRNSRANASIYHTDNFYPGLLASAGRPYIWCDTRGVAVQVYPLQYNPVTNTLRVYHYIEFELSFTNERGINELTRYSPQYNSLSGMRTAIAGHFINGTDNSRYNPVEEAGNMLIIAPASYVESLKPFTAWKAQTGISCETVDVAAFSNAENLRQFVADYYYSKGLTYLLLAGDAQQVPTLQAETGASDNMYGYIAGDDHYPEILTGRFPAENQAQLSIMIDRSIAYEKEGRGNAAYSSFLGIASELGPGDDGESDFQHIRNVGKQLLDYNYSRFDELYDGSQGENDAEGNPLASGVTEALQQGQGAVMYIGHGTSRSWTSSGFSTTEASGLGNTETHPFIWSAGCSSGDFVSTTCLAESFLRAEKNGQPTGAIAVMMSTSRQSWYPPMEAQDEIALILARKKNTVTTRTFGGISMSGCMKMNDKYGLGGYRVTDTWTVFGDPSVVVRTAVPEEIRAHHAPVTGRDAREFVVKLPDSEALACITQEGKLLGAARAEEGFAIISLPQLPETASLTLTVTAYNHKPYIAEIEVSDLPAVAINPDPISHSRKNSAYTKLSWETAGGMQPEFYEVFLAEGSDPVWNNTAMITFEKSLVLPSPLHYNTTYTWKVISHNLNGSSESSTFTFTTIAPPDEDFENQGFPRSNWQNTSEKAWFIDGNTSFEGRYSLRSGLITDNESSTLAYTCNTSTCDFLGFNIRVSSEAGADKLQLQIDGELIAEWSGNHEWSEELFPIDPGEHLIEWIYTKNETGSAGTDAAWIDNIYLPENEAPVIFAGDVTTCPEQEIGLSAQVTGYARILWESRGTGYFSDPTTPDATYHPSESDIASGEVLLSLRVFTNNFCTPVTEEVRLTLNKRPEMPVVGDTILYSGESLEIAMPANSNAGYKLLPTGARGNTIIINSDELQPGPNELTITAQNESGCSDEISFTVTLIDSKRPEINAQLHLYPNPAGEFISLNLTEFNNEKVSIKVFNLAGQLVMQKEEMASFQNDLNLGLLTSGVYMVRVENGETIKNGKFIKTM